MSINKNRGFTFLELLIAVTIMAVGFLAVSQMQFLSFRQKTLANEGVLATNVIQYAADRDLAEIKKRHLHNSFTYLQGLNVGEPIDATTCSECFDHCGSTNKLCATCPCDPFDVLITDATDDGTSEILCTHIDPENFAPENIQFVAVDNCTDNCPANTECLYLVRSVVTDYVDNAFNSDNIVVTITYGVKNLRQILDTDNNDSVAIRETLATQDFQISGHVATNWNQYVQGWNLVNIPHVP